MPGYQKLSSEEFHTLIQELPQKPFLAGERGIRLSLAGAQHKLPVYLEGDSVFLPKGGSPSSHIIKPDIEGIEQSVRNELFCMALAGRIGLKVPGVVLMTTPQELYVVERYDRYRDENGLMLRTHQEDFCQAIGLMSETKYESEGGPSLAEKDMARRIVAEADALASEQQAIWGDAPIVSRILEIIAKQVNHLELY